MDLHRITIVGGGAGGLELATRLGNTLGRRGRAAITLVDRNLTHLWKPLLHEVAAGTFDSHEDDFDYLAQARGHHFDFRLGEMDGLDRERREVRLAPLLDAGGTVVIPRRLVPYDTLVLAVGSVGNDFGIPGVREHCVYLDSREQADRFQHLLMDAFLRAQTQTEPLAPGQLTVAIVGGGATGVELAAELHSVARQLVAYGFDRIVPQRDLKLTIIEAADRVLAGLPPRVSAAAEAELRRLSVEILTGRRVTQVTAAGLRTDDGREIPACIKVWAAGIKAPDVLRDLSLETNRLGQLLVTPTLQTTRDARIFAFGDCAACPRPGGEHCVPPTAQAAHQQAAMLARSMTRLLRGQDLPHYVYRDRGSLVSLSHYGTVGTLMGRLTGRRMIEGRLARLAYLLLYRLHQRALLGTPAMVLVALADLLLRHAKPRLKLH